MVPALRLGVYTVLAAAAASIIAAVLAAPDGALARGLGWRPLAWIGIVSYSLYVWHFPLFGLLGRAEPVGRGPVLYALGVVLSVPIAWLSHITIERPFRRRRRRRPGVPAAAVAPAP